MVVRLHFRLRLTSARQVVPTRQARLRLTPAVAPLWRGKSPRQVALARQAGAAGPAKNSSTLKAPEDWRTPRRFALSGVARIRASVLDCGGPPPLFHLSDTRRPQFRFQQLAELGHFLRGRKTAFGNHAEHDVRMVNHEEIFAFLPLDEMVPRQFFFADF